MVSMSTGQKAHELALLSYEQPTRSMNADNPYLCEHDEHSDKITDLSTGGLFRHLTDIWHDGLGTWKKNMMRRGAGGETQGESTENDKYMDQQAINVQKLVEGQQHANKKKRQMKKSLEDEKVRTFVAW